MSQYKYMIIGGGMAADAAVEGIREFDPNGSVGVLGDELHPPYNRPPLSKSLWKGKPLESIWRKGANGEAITHLGRKAVALDPQHKQVTDDRGVVYSYQKLLVATGGTPRRLPFGGDWIIYFRTLDDYHRLRALTEQGDRFAVIGGGFIGSEIAAALVMNQKQVTMVFPEEGIGRRLFPPELSRFLNDFYRNKGVDVLAGETLVDMETRNGRHVLKTRTGRQIVADGVVAGLGVEPNVELARQAGLQVGDGLLVDAALRTSQPDIFSAGDVASFVASALGQRLRVEHEDNANAMGRAAGHSMVGQKVCYDYLPSFYSDLFELGYEAIGDLDPQLEVVADWVEPYREGVIYYLRDSRVRGVLLWNVWEQIDLARRLIVSNEHFQSADLKHLLPA